MGVTVERNEKMYARKDYKCFGGIVIKKGDEVLIDRIAENYIEILLMHKGRVVRQAISMNDLQWFNDEPTINCIYEWEKESVVEKQLKEWGII